MAPRLQPGLNHSERAELRLWGQLDATQRQRARIDAWEGIIDPLLRELKGAPLDRVGKGGAPIRRPDLGPRRFG